MYDHCAMLVTIRFIYDKEATESASPVSSLFLLASQIF